MPPLTYEELDEKFKVSTEAEIYEYALGREEDDADVYHVFFAAKYGMMSVLGLLIGRKNRQAWEWGLAGACEGGHLAIIDLMIANGAKYWDGGMRCACSGGQLEIAKLMIAKGSTNWENGMAEACYAGHIEIVELMILHGATDWNCGLAQACVGGHRAIVKLMIAKGATDWNWGMERACKGGHLQIVELMISKGANNWNGGIIVAAIGRHLEIVELMISKGATYFDQLFKGGRFDDSVLCSIVCRYYDRIEDRRIPFALMQLVKMEYLVVFNKAFSPDLSRVILSYIFVI